MVDIFEQAIIDGIAEPIMVVGAEYQVKRMNRAARDVWPGDASASKPLLCHEIFHRRDTPCNGAKHSCPLEQARESGQPVTVVHEHHRANGERRFVEIVAAPLWGLDSTFQGITESVRDVTEHVRAQKALRESQTKFRTLAEMTSAAIVIYQGTQLRYANPAAEAISGYTQPELLAMNFWDIVHPEFREAIRERGLARQLGEESPARYEFKILTKNGEERWLDTTARVIELNGKPAGLGTCFDITERVRAQQAAARRLHRRREIEAKNRALLNAIPDMMFRISKDGTFVEYKAAKGLEPLLPPSEFLGKRVSEVLPAKVSQQIMHHLELALQSGDTQSFSYQLPLRGKARHYEARIVSSGVQRDEALAIARDITQRKAREAAVEEERARIARNLHDGLAQSLYLLGLKLDYRRQRATHDAESVGGEPHSPEETTLTEAPVQKESVEAHGITPPTELELEILRLVAQGLTNRDIGDQLGLAEKTIGNRLTGIFNKLNVDNRVQAAIYALRQGFASLEKRNE